MIKFTQRVPDGSMVNRYQSFFDVAEKYLAY